jgi:transposase
MLTSLPQAKEIIDRQQLQVEELKKKLHSAELKVSMLQHQVEQLLRRVYGRRSERLDPNQLMLDPLILETTHQPASSTEPIAPLLAKAERKTPLKPKRNHPGRIPIPEHLERVEIVLDVPEEQKTCAETGKPLKQIGWEVSEKLEYRPGKLIVNVYKRPKYAPSDSTSDLGVITAPMPEHPIERCKADVGLLSYILVSKFGDHLPLYRQNGIFEREGVDIPRATLTSWMMQTYEAIRSLGDELKKAVLESDVLFTDDSIIPLQVKGNGKVHKARLWAYVRGGTDPPLIVYDFSHDRSKKRPLDFLGDYRGFVHADAYSGYDDLFRRKWVTEVGCWVHARRKFDEAVSSRTIEATEVMARIAQLYRVEAECTDMPLQERRLTREERSRPILDGIFERLEANPIRSLPSHSGKPLTMP